MVPAEPAPNMSKFLVSIALHLTIQSYRGQYEERVMFCTPENDLSHQKTSVQVWKCASVEVDGGELAGLQVQYNCVAEGYFFPFLTVFNAFPVSAFD